MLALLRRYFLRVARAHFLQDLEEKDWVILLRDASRIVGFSTIQVISLKVGRTTRRFLFSGDTIVDQAHRQSPALAGSFGHVMLRLMQEHGPANLYWFLITKGFRTYRFLPVFFNKYYPCCHQPTPASFKSLLETIARFKFGPTFDPASGLVRVPGRDHLRPEFAETPPSRRRDPDVAFFLEQNPGHAQGDELACLAPITRTNLNRYAWRVIQSTTVTWHE
jgi:hypothetical protein